MRNKEFPVLLQSCFKSKNCDSGNVMFWKRSYQSSLLLLPEVLTSVLLCDKNWTVVLVLIRCCVGEETDG